MQMLWWCFAAVLNSCLLTSESAVAGSVILTSSVEVTRLACPGDVVTFTCRVIQGTTLTWISEPFIPENDPLTFVNSQMSTVGMPTVVGGFEATLTRIANTSENPPITVADLTSTLVVSAATRLNGTAVECSDQRERVAKVLTIAVVPVYPLNIEYHIQQYNSLDFTITLQWVYPSWLPVDRFNISINDTDGVTDSIQPLLVPGSQREANITLTYNIIHSINIAAGNCAGSSQSAALNIFKAACADPIPPRGGYIHNHTGTVEGSVVRYQCYPSLSPRGVVEAVCGKDGNWRPNPGDLTCRAAAACREPLPPQNGSVDDRRGTTDGYEVIYYCNPGFLPDVQMIAVCSIANGSWVPQPADLVCTKQSPNVSGGQGHDGGEQIIADSVLVVIVVAVVFVVSCSIGILTYVLLHYSSTRKQRQADQQQQRVDYVNVTGFAQQTEPIQLKENPAYEPVTIPH